MSFWPWSSNPEEPPDSKMSPPPPSDSTKKVAAKPSTNGRTNNGDAPLPPDGAGMPSKEDALAALLESFNSTDVPLTARTDPNLPQKEREPMTLTKLWRYVPFFATQGSALTKALVSHHVYGPPKPSWGVELTLFTASLREAAAYSHLSSLARLRAAIDLGRYLPPPKDGIVTPISFRVKRRNLRGFLAEADAAEDGKRVVTGEWVINKRLWKKMQMEFAANKEVGNDKVILYLHGGAYYVMSAETHRFLTISVSRYTESRIFAINYRLAPETRFPGQLHDAVSAYMRLIIDLKIPPENIIFGGDSAGGGLCLATMMYLRDNDYPLPSGGILMSPWVDLTMSCESWTTNQPYDYLPQPGPDDHLNPVKCLLGSNIDKYLTHPYASPLFGNFKGLPPLLIQAGDAEVLRDEITLLARKASSHGVQVEHEIFEDCVHVFQIFLFLEASRKAFQSQRQFAKYKLPSLKKPLDCNMAEMDAEIAADAHVVNEKGDAEPTSLPSSPAGGQALALPEMEGPDTESYDEDDDDTEPLSESTGSGSGDSPGDSPFPEDEDPMDASAAANQRPLLRSFASARDLFMTRAKSTSSAEPSTPPRKRHHSRANTISMRMESPKDVKSALHARSSSHPDFRALLDEYNAAEPTYSTKVYFNTTGDSSLPLARSRSSRSRTSSIREEN